MKFSLRDLFLVTMIVALAAGWWVDRRRLLELYRPYENQRPFDNAIFEFQRSRPTYFSESPKK